MHLMMQKKSAYGRRPQFQYADVLLAQADILGG